MENLKILPKKLPLILILIGTTILAFPAAFGTVALLDTSSVGVGVNESSGQFLLCISIGGFGLFAGYILTQIFQRHSSIFWLCSMLYNFGLSCCYLYFFLAEALPSTVRLTDVRFNLTSDPILLILPWTIFVTIASGYYFRFALRPKKLELS